MRDKKQKGFTLVEILVVVALIAILAAITIIAINPAKNFADTRNAQRSADVSQILNAVTQYTAEDGQQLSDFEDGTVTIPECPATVDIGTGADDLDLETSLVDEYIVAIPEDPSGATDTDTGYDICQTAGGRVEVSAPIAENDKTISVRR